VDYSDDVSVRYTFVWYFILRRYLVTPRDVNRFMNEFRFNIGVLSTLVDPIDLLICIILTIYEPDLYVWMQDEISELVS